MQEMVLKVNYKRASFRNIYNKDVKKGLALALEDKKPDMLVMIHRRGNLFDFFFKSSVTKRTASNVTVPLLVYTHPMASLPQF